MRPKKIALITDSTCDIPSELVQQYQIFVQPHVIIWNGRQYRDRVDLRPEEFYRRLRTEKEMPTTSQASVADFAAAYEQARERGAEEIVAIIVSSKLSGAYQSAVGAVQEAKLPVHVYDSLQATMGVGWQVLAAARAREAGGDAADMLQAADCVRRSVQLYILLDTLEYVYRGGRIGNARRMLGTMLNIKPLLTLDHETGIVEPAGMALTRRKGIEQLFSKFFSMVGDGRLHVAALHGDAAQDCAALYERVQVTCRPDELLTNITGPALGINTGPLAMALCGYSE